MLELGPGHYFGEAVRSRVIGDFAITFSRYRRGDVLPMHSHSHPYLFVPLEGVLLERAIHRDHECSRGWVVFNEAGESHRDHVLGSGATGLNIEIPSTFVHGFDDRGARLEPVVYGHAGPAIWAIGMLQLAMTLADGLQTVRVEEAMVTLLDAMRPARPHDRGHTMFDAVEEAIHAPAHSTLRLADIARAAGVHPAHLCRSFRRRYGCTISRYAARVRADRALADIMHTSEPVARIAAKHGYADQAHLTRAITGQYGAPPGRLRARLDAPWRA